MIEWMIEKAKKYWFTTRAKMFKPKYLIELWKRAFKNAEAPCLGVQLAELVEFLAPLIPPHIWYGADMDANYIPDVLFNFQSAELKKIGDLSVLLEIAKVTDQFRSGVFYAVKINSNIIKYIEVGLDDKVFEETDLDGIIIEICAFDTSYFEIYSEDRQLMDMIAAHFNETLILPGER